MHVSDKEVIESVVLDYLLIFFSESNRDYSGVVDLIEPVVTNRDNGNLLAHFTVEKFRRAIFQMYPDKTLGSNYMNSTFFFQKF